MKRDRHHRVAYRIGYLIVFLGAVYGVFSFVYFNAYLAVFPIVAGFLGLLSIGLLRLNFSTVPRAILSLIPLALNAGYHASLVAPSDPLIISLYISEFGMMLIPWVIFDYREKYTLWTCTGLGLLIILGQYKLGSLLPDRKDMGQVFVDSYLDYVTYGFGTLLLFLVMYAFLYELYLQAQREQRLMNKLKSYQRKIFNDNKTLYESQSKVTEINEYLTLEVRERAQRLEQQNKILAEQSFINSHLLRAPLCRVMALVNLLSSEEREPEKQEMLKMIDDSLDEMNELTKRISSSLEQRGYFDQYETNFKHIEETLHETDVKLENLISDD